MKNRTAQVASVIQSEVGILLMTEMQTNEFGMITISRVEVTPDLSSAYVYITSSKDGVDEELLISRLKKVRGKIQKTVGDHMVIKRTPVIKFRMDEGIQHFNHINEILGEIKHEKDSK